MKHIKAVIVLTVALMLPNIASSNDLCGPHDRLLTAPVSKTIKQCIHQTWFKLGRSEEIDNKFTANFIKTILPTNPEGLSRLTSIEEFDIDYIKTAEIISLLNSHELIKRYIDFIIFTQNSADETRSFGLGKLYTLQAPVFLNVFSVYPGDSQEVVINSLAWGLANNFYPNINQDNYQRLIVGANWELLDKHYKYSELVTKIQDAVYKIIMK